MPIDRPPHSAADLRVVGYEPRHLEGLRALWREHLEGRGVEQREAQFQWLVRGNPFNAGQPGYYVLVEGERVVGMHGHMPVTYAVGDRRVSGYMAHDDLLAGDMRGRGLGRVLLDGVARHAPEPAGALWLNEPNRRLYVKSGWTQVDGLRPYVRLLDPGPRIRRSVRARWPQASLTGLARAALRVRDRMRVARPPAGVTVSAIGRFDERFDALFDRVAPQLGIAVARSAAYLNWRFVERPFSAYRRRAVFDERGALRGYAVLKTEQVDGETRGRVVDMLADPSCAGAALALAHAAVSELAAAGASYVDALATHAPTAEALRRAGFMRGRSPQLFMVRQTDGLAEPARARSIAGWYLTFSDADGDAWKVDAPAPLPRAAHAPG